MRHPRPGIFFEHLPGRDASDEDAWRWVAMCARDAYEFCSRKEGLRRQLAQQVRDQSGVHTIAGWRGGVHRAGFERVLADAYVHPWVTSPPHPRPAVLARRQRRPMTVAIHAR